MQCCEWCRRKRGDLKRYCRISADLPEFAVIVVWGRLAVQFIGVTCGRSVRPWVSSVGFRTSQVNLRGMFSFHMLWCSATKIQRCLSHPSRIRADFTWYNSVHVEKLLVAQIIKKFSLCYRIPVLLTVHKDPAAGPSPEPGECSLCPHTLFKINFNASSHLSLRFPNCISHSGFHLSCAWYIPQPPCPF